MLQAFTPLAVFDRFGPRWRRSVHDSFGQLFAQRILSEESRIGQDRLQLFLQLGFVATAEDELRNKIGRPPSGLTQRHAQSQKLFSVHAFNKLKLPRSERL